MMFEKVRSELEDKVPSQSEIAYKYTKGLGPYTRPTLSINKKHLNEAIENIIIIMKLLVIILLIIISVTLALKKIIVIGSTGKLGYQIVKQLLSYNNDNNNESKFLLTCTCRDISKGRLLYGPDNFNEICCVPFDIVNDSDKKQKQIFQNVDTIVIASGAIGFQESYNIDNIGNKRIIDNAIESNVRKIVLITSLLTSGLESGQITNPQYLLLNLFGGLLINKRQAELHLVSKKDKIDYTIIRPGGLSSNTINSSIKIGKQNTFFTGSINRSQVAQVVVEAITCKNNESKNKIIEIITSKEIINTSIIESLKSI